MPKFTRYIGVDYSGAQTPTASLKGLRVFMAEGERPPRRGVAAAVSAQILNAARHRGMAVELGALPPGPPKRPTVLPMCFPIAISGKR
jgi:hypothetical protein